MAEARVLAQSTATLVASVDDLTRLAVVIDPVIQAAATSSAAPVHLCVTLPDSTRIGPADDGFDGDAAALIERASSQSASFTEVTAEAVDVLTPVTVATGTVVVHTSTHFVYLQSRIWLVWATLAGLGAVIIGLGAFISRRMAERISTPVTEMADVAHRLREGDLSARAHTSAGASPTEVTAVSYTHLDVYKRQPRGSPPAPARPRWIPGRSDCGGRSANSSCLLYTSRCV